MGHKTLGSETHPTKGTRATVKLWPTGPHKAAGMRYRFLRGNWQNTGNRDRDFYLSRMDLDERVAVLEASFLTNAQAAKGK